MLCCAVNFDLLLGVTEAFLGSSEMCEKNLRVFQRCVEIQKIVCSGYGGGSLGGFLRVLWSTLLIVRSDTLILLHPMA